MKDDLFGVPAIPDSTTEVTMINCNEMVEKKQKERYSNVEDFDPSIFQKLSSKSSNLVQLVQDKKIKIVQCQTNESHRSIRLILENSGR